MVATISALTNSAQAASYYELDDYYSENDTANSKWIGKGTEELGLSGEVDGDEFKALLEGKVAGQQLGTMRDGELEHRPGWDLTFSAPKSVSVLAEVAGDRRLIDAHEKAVQTALSMVEEHLAVTRIREDGSIRRENTENLVIASFRHGTSRDIDPQLHSHNVILNMTQDAEGKWRSLEPRAFYQLQKALGAIYRQELAAGAKALGYEINWKDSTFEIAGIDEKVLEAFSQRSAAIEARLAERGKTRKEASAAEKQIAALDTRQKKQSVSHTELIQAWRETANELGWDEDARKQIIAEANERQNQNHIGNNLNIAYAFEREMEADKALSQGIATLSERQSVFSTIALHEAAGKFANGGIGHDDITQAIKRAEKISDIETREYIDRRGASFKGYTSAINIADETKILELEEKGRLQAKPILSPMAAGAAIANAEIKAKLSGHAWNDEQRQATAQILTSRNRINALQGSAGTAKTSTVLATIAKEAEARGIRVTALAPTASAAQVLGEALNTNADTLARHLLSPNIPNKANVEKLWIVDEASLISSKNMAQLFEQADKQQAKVLLVGDTSQLGSIEAGAAFKQLQAAGMETAHLTNILRQTNEQAKAAVEASLEGDAKKALEAIDNGGGKIIEYASREERFAQIAQDYANLDDAQRRKTLIIEPSREGRNQLTKQIRERLAENGILTGDKIATNRLISKDLTKAEIKDIHSYEIGNTIIFSKDYEHKGISKDQAYEIKAIDTNKNSITLEGKNGSEIDWRPKKWGANKSQAYTNETIEFQKGDKIQFTKNDRALGRINGQQSEVVSVYSETRQLTLKSTNNRKITLNLDETKDQHITHNYVLTTFAAQGRTAQNVIINAESTATNLIDQKSFYVAISRAKENTTIYTDNREKLVKAINERSGEKQVALGNAPQAKKVKALTSSLE